MCAFLHQKNCPGTRRDSSWDFSWQTGSAQKRCAWSDHRSSMLNWRACRKMAGLFCPGWFRAARFSMFSKESFVLLLIRLGSD
jgi:hypothetical protein